MSNMCGVQGPRGRNGSVTTGPFDLDSCVGASGGYREKFGKEVAVVSC